MGRLMAAYFSMKGDHSIIYRRSAITFEYDLHRWKITFDPILLFSDNHHVIVAHRCVDLSRSLPPDYANSSYNFIKLKKNFRLNTYGVGLSHR